MLSSIHVSAVSSAALRRRTPNFFPDHTAERLGQVLVGPGHAVVALDLRPQLAERGYTAAETGSGMPFASLPGMVGRDARAGCEAKCGREEMKCGTSIIGDMMGQSLVLGSMGRWASIYRKAGV